MNSPSWHMNLMINMMNWLLWDKLISCWYNLIKPSHAPPGGDCLEQPPAAPWEVGFSEVKQFDPEVGFGSNCSKDHVSAQMDNWMDQRLWEEAVNIYCLHNSLVKRHKMNTREPFTCLCPGPHFLMSIGEWWNVCSIYVSFLTFMLLIYIPTQT